MKINTHFKDLFRAVIFFVLTAFIFLDLNAQTITTIAGTGVNGSLGDGSAATAAQLSFPVRVIFDAAGNLYIADHTNHRIRKVTPAGIISTCVGTGTAGFGGDGGLATAAQISFPVGVVFDAVGNMYIADRNNNRIRKVNTSGIISTVAGTVGAGFGGDGGQATSAQLSNPFGVAVDAAGNIYIGDSNNNRIRKVNTSGIISTIAGTISAGFSGDGGPATSAQLNFPTGVRVDAAGNVYITDFNNNRLRKIDLSGNMSTVAGTATGGFSGDGAAANLAQLNTPYDVNFDISGNVYIVDSGNNRVRKINSAGIISTIAGTISAGFSGDGGLATSAQLSNPAGVAFDGTGNVFIADYNNNRIRKVTCAQPTISVVSSTNVICAGQSATLNASGGSTYTWSPAANGASIVISPTTTSNYTVTGTNSVTGCSSSTVFTQNVTVCIGILNNTLQQKSGLIIYPNPSNDEFSISAITNMNLTLVNELGQTIMRFELSDKNDHQLTVRHLESGIYFIHGNDGARSVKEKVVVIK